MKEQRVDFSTMNDASVADFLKQNKIGLKTEEARKIQDKILKRPPSMTELVVWGIQGSEHSSYKSSKKYLKQLLTEGKEVILGPSEDSGIIKFCEASGKTFGLVLSHESHNHPSQVVPYEGSATGVGGIVRDVACMGSKVIALCDMLRFGDPDRNETKLIFDGVKKGISGYGNPIGVPNLSGEAYFDESYNENCLVNVSCVGLIESNKILHSYVPKNAENEPYVFILVGKPTDMSGFGGASFASADLDEKDKEQNKGAVQEPNPFLERHLLASFYDLFQELDKQDLFDIIGLKDLGAGGVLCATVELAESGGFGAEVFVEQIHKALDDLPPAVILCSETQERFCFAVPERLKDMFLNHFNKKWALPEVSNGAMASYIGNITHDGIYRAIYKDETVCEAKTTDITEGLTVKRPTKARQIQSKKIQIPATDLKTTIKKLLESVNIASREPIYENYDQTVQGLTVLERSEADAGLMCPLRDRTDIQDHEKKNAFSISTGGNPLIGKLSPYNQALYATLNAICKNAAVGTKTNSLTDCLNYGSAEIPEEMWEFAEGIKGLNETSRAFNIPFVSGNVSLYNRGKAKSVAPSCII
ncbi:MAG: AIR synthase related protein, partial [Candidatus Gracilibacteria bacterium]|nr:AIR synthase related protein [Candidatus Gracilibacteria bacterium]